MNARHSSFALAGILAIALVLRLAGLHYGLPWLFYFHDEPQIVLRALRFGTGDLNPHFFVWPGTLLMYLALIAFGGLFVAGRLLGWWSGKAGFAAAYFRDPSAFYLLPRLESVAFGTWSVALANGLGAAAYGAPVGLAAALGLAINALAGHYAHFAHPVTAMTAFTLLGLWAAVKLAEDGGARELALGAFALGCGTAAQYHAGLLALPLGTAVLLRAAREPRALGSWLARGLAMGAGGVALFLLLNPYMILDHAAFRTDLAWITATTAGAAPRGAFSGIATFVTRCVVPVLGLPLALAAAAGTLLALVRRTRADLVLLAFSFGYFLLAGRAAVLYDRYAIPLVVPALLLASRFVLAAADALPALRPGRVWLPVAAAALLCAPSALALVETDWTMRRSDTRVEALRWFEANVPARSRVVLDMLRFWNTATAPLAEDSTRLGERIDEVTHGLTGGGHSSAYLEYYRYRLEHPVSPAYYLRGTELGAKAEPLAAYRAAGFTYAMTNSDVMDGLATRAAPADSSGAAFYRALERECPRIATFRPVRWRVRGPEIRVYRIASAADSASAGSSAP
jgi:hypothetical protein